MWWSFANIDKHPPDFRQLAKIILANFRLLFDSLKSFLSQKWTLNDKTIKNQIFNLNFRNGSIRLLKQLDYEKRHNYQLQIQAKDL